MYEELLIGLRGHAKRMGCDSRCPCCDAKNRGYATCSEELAEQAADAIEELSVIVRAQKAVLDKFPRWIPVTERLPEVNERVMACVKISGELWVYDATRWDGEQWETEVEACYDYWAKIAEPVTHWMPLPEPPKEE